MALAQGIGGSPLSNGHGSALSGRVAFGFLPRTTLSIPMAFPFSACSVVVPSRCPVPFHTIRTACSRTSGEYLFVFLKIILHLTHKLEPSANPLRFNTNGYSTELRRQIMNKPEKTTIPDPSSIVELRLSPNNTTPSVIPKSNLV